MKPDAPTITAGAAPPRAAPPRAASSRAGTTRADVPAAAVPAAAVAAGAAPGRIVYSVSRLNREVRSLLETGIGALWVQGELSNLSRPASGHWYFSLKDRDAQVRCAMFRTRNSRALFEPHEGQLVLARGRVSLYEPRGDYQLLVEQLEDAGLGALQRAFDELKRRLAAEGLFAPERKRPLPAAPRRIGVITSPSGAAIRDILHILARRFPAAAIIVYAVPVQGAAAAPAIVAALDLAGARADCDVLILARGGGALEDLWAFNDERVARAIHRSRLPVVTGIGHEIDFTIADFVADLRAPTPSGAAELVVPDVRGWLHRLDQLQARFAAAARRTLQSERSQLRALRQRLQSSHPGARLRSLLLRLDQLEKRAHLALQSRLARLHSLSQRLDQLEERAQFALQARLASQAARLQSLARALQAVSPLSTLERGFAVITRGSDGQLVTAAEQLAVGDSFDARLARGSLRAAVIARRP